MNTGITSNRIERRSGQSAGTSIHLLVRALDALDYGVMLVNDKAWVRFASLAALRVCRSAHGIRVNDGHLQAEQTSEQQKLLRALAAARMGRRSLLTFRSPEPTLSLAIVPLGESATDLTTGESTVLLVFGKRQVCEPLSVDFFASQHQLTMAETSVLKGLLNGLRPAQIAQDAGVAMSTVRTHISNMRLKTASKSIGELVRLVTVLPPIVSLLAAA